MDSHKSWRLLPSSRGPSMPATLSRVFRSIIFTLSGGTEQSTKTIINQPSGSNWAKTSARHRGREKEASLIHRSMERERERERETWLLQLAMAGGPSCASHRYIRLGANHVIWILRYIACQTCVSSHALWVQVVTRSSGKTFFQVAASK